MLKSNKPENIWKYINKDIGLQKVEGLVNETLTKFFGITGVNTSKRFAFTKGMRIYNSKITSNKKNNDNISIEQIILNEMKTHGIAFEIFIQYFIEKYGKINIGLVPAELDYNHKVDCIIPSGKIKFGFDIKIGSNGSNKRVKVLEHAKNIDNPDYIPSTIGEYNLKDFENSTVNTKNYSNNFIYDTNGILRVNGGSKITKLIKKENFLETAYHKYLKNKGEKDIEEFIKSEILEEFIFIGKTIPHILNQVINFLKYSSNKEKEIKLNKGLGKIKIKHNTEKQFLEIIIFKGNQTKSFCNLFIPITNKLIENIV